ncbi:hypothetical protein [Clostridium vitabionis]|uniref:hypothetical protein n=1 Tax=Clostridium vitabionis TaxID=2784388 RepID=UPI00188B29C2|nr:hypothetical protein [Clostridium vitabionis]
MINMLRMLLSVPPYGPVAFVAVVGVGVMMVGFLLSDVSDLHGHSSRIEPIREGIVWCGVLLVLAPLLILTAAFTVYMARNGEMSLPLALAMLVLFAAFTVGSVVSVKGIIEFKRNLPYFLHPRTAHLSQCRFSEDGCDVIFYRVGGTDEQGEYRLFRLKHKEWQEGRQALKEYGSDLFHATVTYLPHGDVVVGFHWDWR